MFKRILAALLCSVITASVCCSCGAQKSVNTTSDSTQKTTGVQITTAEEPTEPSKENVDPAKAEIANYTAPQKGDKIVTINIKDYGAVKIRLFPEYASKGVENFIGLAEQDYYNGVIFHRIISNFMIQGGDPQGTGMGGQSIWGESSTAAQTRILFTVPVPLHTQIQAPQLQTEASSILLQVKPLQKAISVRSRQHTARHSHRLQRKSTSNRAELPTLTADTLFSDRFSTVLTSFSRFRTFPQEVRTDLLLPLLSSL